ncbi:MAG: FkbM family methyltransferase [Sphingomonas phyllosphaerae]|uniref:FkbM family methyltransferase n=1 Tax=Sphingomonas phyllosphaerae TaxID=257003 RepID=UPI002FF69D86
MSLQRKMVDVVGDRLGLEIFRRDGTGDWIEKRFVGQLLSALEVDCVLDVGANRGQYGEFLRRAGYRGLILSFEPGITPYQELEATARRDGNWHTFNMALGQVDGTLPMNVMKIDVFSSFRAPSVEEDASLSADNQVERVVEVPVARIDGLFEGLMAQHGFARPFLKMDTQGYDLEVLRGAGAAIAKFVGLSSEIAIRRLYKDSPSMLESIAAIVDAGFSFVNLVPVHPDRVLNPLELNSYAVRDDLAR